MPAWTLFVDIFRAALFALAHLSNGSLGTAIVILSILVRLALLPWTLKLAIRTREASARIKGLAPEIARLRKRYASDRKRLGEETLALYRKHGITPVPEGTIPVMLAQLPIGIALQQAVATGVKAPTSFLWISDLARPDAALAVGAAVVAGATVAVLPADAGGTTTATIVSGALTLAIAWRMSAAVGLYWTASSVVGVGQSLLVRRAPRISR
jgi:YidC/Oxa1 family membrane protein insertase